MATQRAYAKGYIAVRGDAGVAVSADDRFAAYIRRVWMTLSGLVPGMGDRKGVLELPAFWFYLMRVAPRFLLRP